MSDSIKISPKHGINPTIPLCFWCGNPKDEIALMGKLENDEEAPKNCIINYEPCEKCQEIMDQGITIMEADEKPIKENFPEMQKGVYPTGRYLVVTESSFRHTFENIINDPAIIDATIEKKQCFMIKDIYNKLLTASEQKGE